MTTITEINGHDITKSPKTLAKACDTIKSVVDTHNAACGIKIKSRITNGGEAQVSVATPGGRAKKWFHCHLLTNVQAFADGVADTVASKTPRPNTPMGAWLAGPPNPEREFVSHTDESAYFFGTLAGA